MEEHLDFFDKAIADKVKSGDNQILIAVYYRYKESFRMYCLKNHAFAETTEDAHSIESIYHDVILALQRHCLKGLADPAQKVRLWTFLVAIGKNLVRNHFNRMHAKWEGKIDRLDIDQVLIGPREEENDKDDRISMVNKVLQGQLLKPKCRDLLTMYYYRAMSLESLQHRMGYSSLNAVKKQKARCLQQLHGIVQKAINIQN